jgi:C4-dicarboxylate-specific signal transduction histidine kinase
MSDQWEIISEAGLQFFGKMTASISHEIKNALAIINENAGLLEDLTVLAEKGRTLDPERIKTLAGGLVRQVQRADSIVKNLNRFAHSIDEPVMSVDLKDIMSFVVSLSGRMASMRGARLQTEPSPTPVMIRTKPFYLKNLLWLCLDFAIDAVGETKTVLLTVEAEQNGARIALSQLEGLAQLTAKGFPGERESTLLGLLKADLTLQQRPGAIFMTFPWDIRV